MRLPQKGSVQPPSSAARPSRGEIRRLVLMAVGAVIVLAYIGKFILERNIKVERDREQVGVSAGADLAPPVPGSLPDGAEIVLPEGGEALADVQDFTDLEVDDPAFLYLIKTVKDQTAEEISARVEPAADYMEDAPGNRGRYVRAVGTLDHIEPIWLPKGNPSGVERPWWATLIGRDRTLIQVVILEKEREFVPERDTVMVEGPFFKARRYVTMQGRRWDFPLVIGKVMRAVREPTYEEAFPNELGYVVAGVVALMLVALFIGSLRSSRRDAEMDRVRRARRQSRRLGGDAPGPPPGAPSSGGPEPDGPSP